MALARVKVWIPGDVLTAADQNGEFNNIINNPITLISPSTGAINFNLQAHTGILPSAITATSGSAGQVLTKVGTATVWGNVGSGGLTTGTPSTGDLLVFSSNGVWVPLVQGSTGTVLAVTSSGVSPSYTAIPPDGGLSTGTPSTGALYYLSTDGKLVPLAIGTSGQVLTVSTGLLPSWAAASGGSGGGGFSSTSVTYFDDFLSLRVGAAGPHFQTGQMGYIATTSATPQLAQFDGGAVTVPGSVVIGPVLGSNAIGIANQASTSTLYLHVLTTLNPALDVYLASTAGNAGRSVGLSTGLDVFTSGVGANAIYFRTLSTNVFTAVSVNAGTTFTIATTAVVTSSAFTKLSIHFSSSGSQATILTNGVTAGTFTSSQVPPVSTPLGFSFGSSVTNRSMRIDAWVLAQDRMTNFIV